MFERKSEREQYGQGRNCGIHTSTQQTEVWPNAVANKSACEGHNCMEGHTSGLHGPPHELHCSPCDFGRRELGDWFNGVVGFGQQVAAFRVWIPAPLQNSHQGAVTVA